MRKYLLMVALFFACSEKKDLLIKTLTATPTSKDSTVTAYNENYLEIKLSVFDDGTWQAEHSITRNYTSDKDYLFKRFLLCDQTGRDLRFKESTEFLNYVSGYGYELVKEVKSKSGLSTDYTLKKK